MKHERRKKAQKMEMRAEFSIFCFLQLLILLIVWLKRATNSILLIFPTRLVLMKQLWVRYLHSSEKNICEGSGKNAQWLKARRKSFFFLRGSSGGKKPSKPTHWNECTCALYRYNTISLLLFSSSASFFFISGVQWGLCHMSLWIFCENQIFLAFQTLKIIFQLSKKFKRTDYIIFPKSNLE